MSQATVISPGSKDQIWIVQELCTPLVTTDESRATFDLAHVESPANGGTPPHVHHREDEMFYVIDGTFNFMLNDRVTTGGPGTAVFLPRNITHAYTNLSGKSGKLLVGTWPSGLMKFFSECMAPCTDPNTPTDATPEVFAKLEAACTRNGIELLPDWPAPEPALAGPANKELWVNGLHVTFLLTGEQTGGAATVCEIIARPGDFVPPHTHRTEDEMFYVLEGEIQFDLEGKKINGKPGTFVHVPKQVLHGFGNASDKPAKLVDFHTPGGFDKFFEDCGTICTDRAKGPPNLPFDLTKFTAICNRHGMDLPQNA